MATLVEQRGDASRYNLGFVSRRNYHRYFFSDFISRSSGNELPYLPKTAVGQKEIDPDQQGNHSGDGEGATRAHAAKGDRDLSVKATAQDPYFRAVLTRLGKEVQFPRDLAVDLRSGRPIAAFVLAADGTVSDIRLHTTSGFRGFDAELLRAVRTLKDLGPVPDRLLDGRSRLKVLVPFEFRSPLAR